MNVVVLDSKYWPGLEKRGIKKSEIKNATESAAKEVEGLISSLSPHVNLVVDPTVAENVIPETGGMGMTYSDEYVSVSFDHTLPYGKEKLLKEIRSTTYHELVHAVSFLHDPWQPGVLFGCVTEGLATVFEREYAHSEPLWGKYEDDTVMQLWLQELKELPDSEVKNHDYFIKHPDGRKWIVYKTGTWIIDKLLESGEDLFELMQLNHKDVIAKFEAF